MQGANKKSCKLSKRPKLRTCETAVAEVNTDENSQHGTIIEKHPDETSNRAPVGYGRTTTPTPTILESRCCVL